MVKIAIVEDDRYLLEELVQTFEKAGYEACPVTSFACVEQELAQMHPELVVLDVNLPGKSGYELCKILKAKASVPILILTARDTLTDELTALGLGADEFLAKPCPPRRLLARTQRLLQTYDRLKGVLCAGPLSLDCDTYKLMFRSEIRILAETEGKILRMLMERCPEIVGKGELFSAVWGTEEFVDENILQVNVSRLRKHLSEIGLGEAVRNIRGQGYVLEVEKL